MEKTRSQALAEIALLTERENELHEKYLSLQQRVSNGEKIFLYERVGHDNFKHEVLEVDPEERVIITHDHSLNTRSGHFTRSCWWLFTQLERAW